STAGGIIAGTFGAWTGLFDTILKPENYSEQQSGWFAFGTLISCIVGGLCFGALADTRYFQRRLKILIVLAFIFCFLAVFFFELSVHTVFYDKPLLHSTSLIIGLSVAFAGFFQGAALPLIYEAMAEIMFPLPESLSASILLQWLNITALILLFIAPNRAKLINLLVLIALGTSIIMSLLARITYRRRDEDERKECEKENEQLLNGDNMDPYQNQKLCTITNRFSVGKSTPSLLLHEFCTTLVDNFFYHFVKFPSTDKKTEDTTGDFLIKYGYPMCLGSVVLLAAVNTSLVYL
ncbi:unnamed protein product, partial [Adineta steineri]